MFGIACVLEMNVWTENGSGKEMYQKELVSFSIRHIITYLERHHLRIQFHFDVNSSLKFLSVPLMAVVR